ncbi:hypothetical protein CTRI78_v002463 [Colletotrichum trifolii]|uniref:DUF7580 domain-containing protein n=1 Tax=Colletotrichum trifolii TaxID=5466 RepID=A0A4R8RRC9_COLTR|nr:hypothetical protein CTRI78_v002463 [Colletotrichum trifolii]
MSGFEVAGVVLGSIPLLISALEHYQQGISSIRKWRNYDRELRSLIRNLETERVRFQDVCEKLLVGLVPSSQIESMVEQPFGTSWQEDNIQSKIRARLWRSFNVFEKTVEDMREAIREMMQKLDLEADEKMKWLGDSFIIREFKKASFTLKRSDHAEEMTTIKDGITNLESLIDRNIQMEPERKSRSQGRLLKLVREISGGVHRALRSSFQCSCAHQVHLGLASRSTDMGQKDEDEDIIQKLDFQLALTWDEKRKGVDADVDELKLHWEEVVVKAMAREAASTQALTVPAPTWTNNKQKTVSFALSTSTTATASCVAQTSTMVFQKPFSAMTINPLASTINMCESIRQSQKAVAIDCYGYGMITDQKRAFRVIPEERNCDRNDWAMVSLREVLEKPGDFPHMSYSAKLHLAATISSSFLQLHQTPWLPGMLTNSDILFMRKGPKLNYEQAFVMNYMPERLGDQQPASILATGSRCPELLSLGLLLLELSLGKPIEWLRTENEKPPSGAPRLLYESMTAQRLLQQKQLGSPNYVSAVQRCIWGEFARSKLDLNDEDFRQEMYEKVVALLETDLKNATWK